MKIHLKRHFSLLLAVLLVLTMIPVSTIKVSAKGYDSSKPLQKQTAKKADKKTTKEKTKKKQRRPKSKEAENGIYSSGTPAERNFFYRKTCTGLI